MPAQTNPTFLNLPAEIRITIYELAFTGLKIDRRLTRQRSISKQFEEPIGILMSNKQIYDEAMPIFYQTASFWATFGSDRWADWLIKLPAEYRQRIKEIRLRGRVMWCGAADDFLPWHVGILQQHGIELTRGVIWMGVVLGDAHEVWLNELWEQVDRYSVDGVYERTKLDAEERDLLEAESESFDAFEAGRTG